MNEAHEAPAAVTRPEGHISVTPCSWGAAPHDQAEEPSPLPPGTFVSGTPYMVVRLVGEGGMGEVYEVEHAALGRRAALKVLHRDHHDRPDLAARLREEARLSARLRHPNLVEVFDLGATEDGRPYFAMPLLQGNDLREELARVGALPAEKAIAYAVQALEGLEAAHAAGVVHRDLKLDNLFLEEDGTVRVIDFGVAKLVSVDRTPAGACPGTPRCMAPEQCTGASVDARADVYAMGLSLYEMCTGRGPFDELQGSDHALRLAQCDRTPAPPSQVAPGAVPRELSRVILRALAKAPSARFQSAAEMAAALRRLLPPVRPLSPVSRRRRRRARWARDPSMSMAVSAMAVAFLALGLAFGRSIPLADGAERPPPASATKL